jgi:hypothetical protein
MLNSVAMGRPLTSVATGAQPAHVPSAQHAAALTGMHARHHFLPTCPPTWCLGRLHPELGISGGCQDAGDAQELGGEPTAGGQAGSTIRKQSGQLQFDMLMLWWWWWWCF